MITHIDITGVGSYAPDEKAKRYIIKKIGSLDRLAPRHARKTMRADVKLDEVNRKSGNKYEVEVVMHLPEKTLTAKDATLNVLAATDIVEAKLAAQLRKYKQTHSSSGVNRRLIDRFKRKIAKDQQPIN